MRQTNGCIVGTVVPVDVIAIVLAFVLFGSEYWLANVIGGLFVGSLLWLGGIFLMFSGTGEDERG